MVALLIFLIFVITAFMVLLEDTVASLLEYLTGGALSKDQRGKVVPS